MLLQKCHAVSTGTATKKKRRRTPRGRKRKVTLLRLRTNDPGKLMVLCQELLQEAEACMGQKFYARMWGGSVRAKEIGALVKRLNTAANRCASVIGDHEDTARQVAETLLAHSEDVTAAHGFIEDMKKKPLDIMRMTATAGKHARRALKNIPQHLLVQCFHAMVLAVLKKVSPRKVDLVCTLFSFLKGSKEDGTINCSVLSAIKPGTASGFGTPHLLWASL